MKGGMRGWNGLPSVWNAAHLREGGNETEKNSLSEDVLVDFFFILI